MHQVSSSSLGTASSSRSSAYWIERVIPGFGLVSVPSRSKKIVAMPVVPVLIPPLFDLNDAAAQGNAAASMSRAVFKLAIGRA
ncbi:hypothetical protein ACVW0J_005355 [Bradyrhizobium sp. i1.7.7]